MYLSKAITNLFIKAKRLAAKFKHEYVTLEHLVVVMCEDERFIEAFEANDGDVEVLKKHLNQYLSEELETVEQEIVPTESYSLQQAFIMAYEQAKNSGKAYIELEHIVAAIMTMPECFAAYYMAAQDVTVQGMLFELCHNQESDEEEREKTGQIDEQGVAPSGGLNLEKYVTNLNEAVKTRKEPLVEREDILERTIQVLCRFHKNNPIHLGEPGVGKTAITLGLAKLINEDKVPEALKGATIYELDLSAVLAGTQYRGDFENRLKKILEEIKKQPKPIIYIDEIHNIVGAGAIGTGSLDASNLLKPYLTEDGIRFIGATTYDEYKKYFEKDKGLVRRFQTIEVKEPSVKETIAMLKTLQGHYEKYHGVSYTEEAIEAAAVLSQKYITERFLPDKAIDLLDEAGAYVAMRGANKHTIDLKIMEETLAKICHVPKQTVEKSEVKALKLLDKSLKAKIFGQDEAIEEIVRCIKLSRSGLGNENKPVANLLFVGPTGVGKTEIVRCLAKELGVKLIRFDMSEYGEKQAASKLIGSPAGYVGYEEGGLLTDAIRKTPHCVLLLDEIEKAHPDIFNMLLQVMDYATLTDNKGRKADFRNVVLIMTSNAGASKIGKSLVGFGDRKIQGEAIGDEVKRTFTPEFRNRLTSTVVFNYLDEAMIERVVKKELNEFKQKLEDKHIEAKFSEKCIQYIAKKGLSNEFGAREIGRIIEAEVKPLLIDEILFGKLAKGGKVNVTVEKDRVICDIE